MSYAYSIFGSEDGPIAIATSPAKAVTIAKEYVEQNGNPANWEGTHDMGQAVSKLRQRDCFTLTINNLPAGASACSSFASADIEKFELNVYAGREVPQ